MEMKKVYMVLNMINFKKSLKNTSFFKIQQIFFEKSEQFPVHKC